jgi:hypothetical protein
MSWDSAPAVDLEMKAKALANFKVKGMKPKNPGCGKKERIGGLLDTDDH